MPVLMAACTKQFAQTHLPSHNQWHHARVWAHAKKLVFESAKQGVSITEKDIEQLIIAVFFHDQGMSETASKDHGKVSRKLCKAFIKDCGVPPPDFVDEVLDAIEHHDKKEYDAVNGKAFGFDLQKFVTIADDLDAFGIVGAYRYTEIYLLRKIKPEAMPEAILTNMAGRYNHFAGYFGQCQGLVKSTYQRYIVARNFFKDLNFQINQIGYSEDVFLGPIGVVNIIQTEILEGRKSLSAVCQKVLAPESDFYCHHFWERVQKEL